MDMQAGTSQPKARRGQVAHVPRHTDTRIRPTSVGRQPMPRAYRLAQVGTRDTKYAHPATQVSKGDKSSAHTKQTHRCPKHTPSREQQACMHTAVHERWEP